MKQVELGSQGLVVSAQGLGCMGMGTTYGQSDERENLATLSRALELGITFFDTAQVYGPYLNEELLGKFFVGKRNQVVIGTKIGFKLTAFGKLELIDGKPAVSGDPAYVRSAVEGSLRRLQTDRLDLLYLHRIDPTIAIEDRRTIGIGFSTIRSAIPGPEFSKEPNAVGWHQAARFRQGRNALAARDCMDNECGNCSDTGNSAGQIPRRECSCYRYRPHPRRSGRFGIHGSIRCSIGRALRSNTDGYSRSLTRH
jgi:Aldo/keto reductase family